MGIPNVTNIKIYTVFLKCNALTHVLFIPQRNIHSKLLQIYCSNSRQPPLHILFIPILNYTILQSLPTTQKSKLTKCSKYPSVNGTFWNSFLIKCSKTLSKVQVGPKGIAVSLLFNISCNSRGNFSKYARRENPEKPLPLITGA